MNRTQLSQLAVLATVAHHGSFRKAAAELGIAPGAEWDKWAGLGDNLAARLEALVKALAHWLVTGLPLVVIAPLGHRLLTRRRLSLKDLAAERFTVADLCVASVLTWARPAPHLLSAYPLTDAWLHSCVNRPALVQLRAKA